MSVNLCKVFILTFIYVVKSKVKNISPSSWDQKRRLILSGASWTQGYFCFAADLCTPYTENVTTSNKLFSYHLTYRAKVKCILLCKTNAKLFPGTGTKCFLHRVQLIYVWTFCIWEFHTHTLSSLTYISERGERTAYPQQCQNKEARTGRNIPGLTGLVKYLALTSKSL